MDRRILLLWLQLLVLIIPFVVVGDSCPSMCHCTASTANCTSASLTQLPSELNNFIVSLNFDKNNVAVINRFTFSESGNRLFPKLNYLSLKDNNIKSIEPSAFVATRYLIHLILKRNKITQINPVIFKNIRKLQTLFLNNNAISVLEQGTYRELRRLVVLDLSGNEIQELMVGTFKGLISLKLLSLKSNKIEILEPNVFRDLRKLVILELTGNYIKTIERQSFRGLYNLQILGLMFNMIKTLDVEAFRDLSNLLSLDFDDNMIESIPGNIFKNLANLQNLYMSQNLIDHIDYDAFLGLTNLKQLQLMTNPIRYVDSRTFETLTHFELLRLTANKRLVIPENSSFIVSEYLRELDLSECNLRHIPTTAFYELPNLVDLELYYNHFKSFDRDILMKSKRLKILNLDINPFPCDCNMKSLWVWSKQHKVILKAQCNNTNQVFNVSRDAFENVHCGEEIEVQAAFDPNEEIETFTQPPFIEEFDEEDYGEEEYYDETREHKDYGNDDKKRKDTPEFTNDTSVNVDRSAHDDPDLFNEGTSNDSTTRALRGSSEPQEPLLLSKLDSDVPWVVILILCITVCLLLLIIAGLLYSLIIFKHHNRTIIISMPPP